MSATYNFKKFKSIQSIIRLLLRFSTCLLFFCIIITLINGSRESYTLNYFIVYASIFILFFTAIALLIISIFYKVNKKNIFQNLKKEFYYFLINSAGLALLSFIIHNNF